MRLRILTLPIAASVVGAALALGACGKKGPPLPPLRSYPEAVPRISSRQIGDRVVLSFPRPTTRTDGTPLAPDTEIDILMTAREPAPRRPMEFTQNPDVTWAIPRAEWDAYAQGRRLDVGISLGRIATSLRLPETATLKGRKLSFLILVVEGGRKHSAPSEIESFPLCEAPPAPAGGAIEVVEEGLRLSWSPPAPAGAFRYVIYRREEGGPMPDTPITPSPLETTTYLDTSAVLGKPYRYVARVLSGALHCESADSTEMSATRVDTFPPAPPEGLAAVVENGAIRLFWRPNREPDLYGYRVYRTEGGGAEWKLLTPDEITTTSYTDRDVTAGVVYSYAVTARDGAAPPNESGKSQPAVETMEGSR